MKKTPMKSFEIIKEMYEYFVKKSRDLEPKLMICEKEDFDNVENALKDYVSIYDKTIAIYNGVCVIEYPLSEYGKSFALTKKELEK